MLGYFILQSQKSGSSSSGRATASQAVGSGFEPRLPLFYFKIMSWKKRIFL